MPSEETGGGPSKKIVGALSAIAGVVVGFVVAVATDQTKEFVERADACYGALEKHEQGLQKAPRYMDDLRNRQDPDRFNTAAAEWNSDIVETDEEVASKCPVAGNKNEYLQTDTVSQFQKFSSELEACSQVPCDTTTEIALKDNCVSQVRQLQDQANKVKEWGVIRRTRYALTHLY